MFSRLRNRFKKESKRKEPYILKGEYGLSYQIDPNSALDDQIVKHGIIQDWIATKLGEFINESGIVLDIGANAGLLTLPFAKKHVPKGKVYAFEPDMENYKQLEKNIELNVLSNAIPQFIALQDDSSIKEIEFFHRRAIDGDKLTNRGLSTLEKISLHNVSSDTVQCLTIDQFVKQNKLHTVDFIKIDVEGSEYRVLKGGIDSIEKFCPIIQYEYSPTIDKLTNSNNTNKSFSFLSELGYQQYIIQDEKKLVGLKEYDSSLKDCNVLTIHKSNSLSSSINEKSFQLRC